VSLKRLFGLVDDGNLSYAARTRKAPFTIVHTHAHTHHVLRSAHTLTLPSLER
jgi:hypothetical protein